MWRDLLEDVHRYPGDGLTPWRLALASPGFWAVATYRVHRAVYSLPPQLRGPARWVVKPAALAATLLTGIDLPPAARIGPGLYIGHFGTIVISGDAVIGSRCNLSQGVTLGVGNSKDGRRGAPLLGDRVYVGPGAKVFGPISVGDDVAIGANAVVNRDVAPGMTVAGVPARVVNENGSRGMIELRDGGRPATGVPPSSPRPTQMSGSKGGESAFVPPSSPRPPSPRSGKGARPDGGSKHTH